MILSGSELCFQNFTTKPDPAAGKIGRKQKNINTMKTMRFLSALLICLLLAGFVKNSDATPPGLFGVHVVISSKSYWDGPSQSCLPREHGGCCHIWIDGMVPGPGEISGEIEILRGKELKFTVSRAKGVSAELYRQYFSGGKFTLDGPVTFESRVLEKLGLDPNFVLAPGVYPVSVRGDDLIVTFK